MVLRKRRESVGNMQNIITNNKTKNRILKAVVDLLPNRSLAKITVAEISRTANINRKTFYKYFDTPTQVILIHLQDQILSDLLNNLGQSPAGKAPLDITNHKQTEIVLTVLNRYRSAIKSIYHATDGLNFELFDDFLTRLRRDWLPFKNCQSAEEKFMSDIFSEMAIKLLTEWLVADQPLPISLLLKRADYYSHTSISDLSIK